VSSVTPITSPSARSQALALAARVGCDWRTALRALQVGPHAIRTAYVRDALAREIQAMVSPQPETAPDSTRAKGAPPTKESTPDAETKTTNGKSRTERPDTQPVR
jgi:hypothetical protein